jgi:hypothetical protein
MAQKKKRISKIDEEIEETFPASDPPAFMAGSLGAPKGRKSSAPSHKKSKKQKPGKARAVAKPQSKKAKRKQAGTKRRKSR